MGDSRVSIRGGCEPLAATRPGTGVTARTSLVLRSLLSTVANKQAAKMSTVSITVDSTSIVASRWHVPVGVVSCVHDFHSIYGPSYPAVYSLFFSGLS